MEKTFSIEELSNKLDEKIGDKKLNLNSVLENIKREIKNNKVS